MAHPTHSRSGLKTREHYCARCLTEAAPRQTRCPGCRTPFTGAGRFDLLAGPAPSRAFAFLFDRSKAAHASI